MSEEREKVKSVKYLPIFLSEKVLMPTAVTVKPVHFSKAHDIALLEDVMKDNKMFGVCYSENGKLPEVGSFGCLAEITSESYLENGGAEVKFTGVIRFKIEDYVEMNTTYPLAEVSFYEDYEETENEETLQQLANAVFSIFHEVKLIIFKRYNIKTNSRPLQPKPIPFSFIMQELFAFGAEIDLKLLASRLPSERLRIGVAYMNDFLEQAKDENKLHTILQHLSKYGSDPNLN